MVQADTRQHPTLPQGFRMRPITVEDIPAAADVANAQSLDLFGVAEFNANDLQNEWSSPGFDIFRSTRLIETEDGRIIAVADLFDDNIPPVNNWGWFVVHPEFRNQGLEDVLLDWAIERAREAVARCEDDLRVVVRLGAPAGYRPMIDAFEARGMQHVRSFWRMHIDRPDNPEKPQIPGGISIRPMNYPEEFRAVIEADNEAFRDHWGFVEQPIEEELKFWQHMVDNDEKFDPSLWFVATDDASGEIAGVAMCRSHSTHDERYGHISHLSVRRGWRQRGLGLALLLHVFEQFWARGKEGARLGVDTDSLTGATRLYERAGMRPIREFTSWEYELRPGRSLENS